MVLSHVLPVSRLCTHVKGHGGAKSAVGTVFSRLYHNRFVLRTDVKSYDASIDHHVLLDQHSMTRCSAPDCSTWTSSSWRRAAGPYGGQCEP